VRGKGSPRGGKAVRSPGAARDEVTSPKGRGGTGDRKEQDRAVPAKSDQGNNDASAKNVSAENGVAASKSTPIDDVVMEVKSSLSSKLVTATILKDLEEKRRQQPNNPEDSSNGVSGGVPASEAGVGAEIKGFKRPAKRVNKERTVTGDGVSEEEETEVIDDWRDDIKSQGREKRKSKDRKEKFVSKRSKDEEERLGSAPVVTGAKLTAEREVQNLVKEAVNEVGREPQAKESKMSGAAVNGGDHDDRGRWGTADMESDFGGAERQGEGSLKLMLPPADRARDPAGEVTETRRVTENVVVATCEFSNAKVKEKVKEKVIERNVVTEKVVRTNIREEKVVTEVGGEKSSVVSSLKEPKVLEKDSADANLSGEADEEMGEDTHGEKKNERKAVEVSEGDEERERSRKKSREGDDAEDRDKRRRKKSQEIGDDDEEEERHRERHRRHQKKHRREVDVEKGDVEKGDVEKGEDEDEEKEDAEQRRERRRERHKKKHRKDESEKREKRRRKHRHHRRRRSQSESPEASPSGGDKAKRGDEDDGTTKHKQHRSRQTRSPSAEAGKGAAESDEGVTRKRSSSRQKKNRRDPSKSASESPSSSE
jgi:hypothetical protein